MLSRSSRIAKQFLKNQSLIRPFSTALAAQGQNLPAELTDGGGFPLTQAYFADLEVEHNAFNERCIEELQQMNGTLVENLKNAGGLQDWDESRDQLTKTFDFDSFEQCQAFVQTVGKYAETKDHHPEWQTTNGGKSISIRLTSHFAGNQVTLSDYQMASQMNQLYTDTKSTFNPFPRYSESQWVSLCVATGSFVTAFSLFKYYTTPLGFETDVQRGVPLKRSGGAELDQEVTLALSRKLATVTNF